MRARFSKAVVRRVSGAPADGTVSVMENGTTNPLAVPIYADNTGTDTLPNPFSFTNGQVEFYLDVPQRVRLVITPTDGLAQTFDNNDVSPPPGDYVRTSGEQTITGLKRFDSGIAVAGSGIRAQPGWVVTLRDQDNATRAMVTAAGLTVGSVAPQSGAGVLGINNASAVPASNPSSGVVVYAEGGLLKVRQQNGTVVTVGSIPTNLVTTDTTQTIPGQKDFDHATGILTGAVRARSTGNLELRDNAGTARAVVTTRGLTVGGTPPGINTGVNVLAVNDASTVPTASATGTALVYSQGGVLKSRSAAGVVRAHDLDVASGDSRYVQVGSTGDRVDQVVYGKKLFEALRFGVMFQQGSELSVPNNTDYHVATNWDVANYDLDGFTWSGGVLTVKRTGAYTLGFHFRFALGNAQGERSAFIAQYGENDVLAMRLAQQSGPGSGAGGAATPTSVSVVVHTLVAANQRFRPFVFQSSGASLSSHNLWREVRFWAIYHGRD